MHLVVVLGELNSLSLGSLVGCEPSDFEVSINVLDFSTVRTEEGSSIRGETPSTTKGEVQLSLAEALRITMTWMAMNLHRLFPEMSELRPVQNHILIIIPCCLGVGNNNLSSSIMTVLIVLM